MKELREQRCFHQFGAGGGGQVPFLQSPLLPGVRHFCGRQNGLRGLFGGGEQSANGSEAALWIVGRSGLWRFGIFGGLRRGCLCGQVDDFDSGSISRRFDLGGDSRVRARSLRGRADAGLAAGKVSEEIGRVELCERAFNLLVAAPVRAWCVYLLGLCPFELVLL